MPIFLTRHAIVRLVEFFNIWLQKIFQDHQDKLLMSEFEVAFAEKYRSPLCPGQYGYPSLMALIQSPIMMEEHFLIRGRGPRKMIW